METKKLFCFDCHALFYYGENHMCEKIDKSHFISKLVAGNKHAEGSHGWIPHVQCNGVGQIEVLNYPASSASSTNIEIQLPAANLQNTSDGGNLYLKDHQEEHRDFTVMNTSEQNEIFDSSLQPSHLVSSRGNAVISGTSHCLVGVKSPTSDTRQETTNYSTAPGISTPAHEFKNDNIESSITESINHHYTLTPILNAQSLLSSRVSGETSSEGYCATTGINIQDLHCNTDSCKPESHAGMNVRSIFSSSNILSANCISTNYDVVPVQRPENEAPHLQSLHQAISRNFDISGNNLAENVAPLMSESDEYHLAGPSHLNVEAYCDLQDGRFICRLCENDYNSKGTFIVHFRIHTGETPYACDICSERFIQKAQLDYHYKIHYKVKPYPCDMCEKRFYTRIDLDNHYQIHSVERPYACDKCSKRFSKKHKLNRHLPTHTGEKPYPCDKCDKAFVKNAQLAQHRLTHIED